MVLLAGRVESDRDPRGARGVRKMITIPWSVFYLALTFAVGVGLILGGMFRVSAGGER